MLSPAGSTSTKAQGRKSLGPFHGCLVAVVVPRIVRGTVVESVVITAAPVWVIPGVRVVVSPGVRIYVAGIHPAVVWTATVNERAGLGTGRHERRHADRQRRDQSKQPFHGTPPVKRRRR